MTQFIAARSDLLRFPGVGARRFPSGPGGGRGGGWERAAWPELTPGRGINLTAGGGAADGRRGTLQCSGGAKDSSLPLRASSCLPARALLVARWWWAHLSCFYG